MRAIAGRMWALVVVVIMLLTGAALGQQQQRGGRGTTRPVSPGMVMDYRPVYSSSLVIPPPRAARGARGVATRGATVTPAPQPTVLAARAITVDVGNDAAVSFDTDTCRYIGGWTGGFLDMSRTNVATLKGSGAAVPAGKLLFNTPVGPGWTSDKFVDARPGGYGAMPAEQIHYRGFYRHGKNIIFSYTVGSVELLDMPGTVLDDRQVVFSRTLRVGKSSTPLRLVVEGTTAGRIGVSGAIGLVDAPSGTKFGSTDDLKGTTLELPALAAPKTFKIVFAPVGVGIRSKSSFASRPGAVEDLEALCKGGPASLGAPTVTGGTRAPDSKPYVVDTIKVPFENPGKSWMRTTALDFFSDGRCAVCTMGGDVWIVSNIDDKLQNVTWKRFATGLYEPLGLKIVNEEIYVLGRDQITRLHDLNGDGEADFYENFSNGGVTDPVYHAFKLDLQTDSEGNFYYMVDGNQVPLKVPMHAAVLKVSKDGKKTEVYATGFRAPDGMGMGPNDELISADNQGNWTPVCRINLMKKGGFYGFNGDPRVVSKEEFARAPKTYDVPVCWVPYDKDNSTGGEVFVTGKKFGPLEGHMLSTSYGKCRLFEVMWEQVDGVPQGATAELPLTFASGIHRARMNPVDGQVYVCGLKGWQTSAAQDGCLERVRYTGKPFNLPVEVHVKNNGIALTFDRPLDPTTANDEQSFGIEEWNYRWSSEYGSKLYKVSDPSKVGTDEVAVKSAKLQSGGKTVFLEIPKIHPVMQMRIQVHVNSADGTPVECDVDETINHVPGSTAPPVLTSPLPSNGGR